MGKRGPAKTPTNILKLRDAWRGKRRKGEPQPQPHGTSCPRSLSQGAKAVWRRLAPQLAAMNLLGKTDREALARYCEYVSFWQEVTAAISQHKLAVLAKNSNAAWGLRASLQLADVLLRLEQQFGLTPSARANLATDIPSDEDEQRGKWERLLG